MGLAEKRILKAYQEGKYQEFLKEISELGAENVEFDIDWESLPYVQMLDVLEEGLTEVYFKPILESLQAIAVDDMGKEAVQETLKKVVIKNTKTNSHASMAYKWDNGTLLIEYVCNPKMSSTAERTKLITKLLEKNM